MERGTYDVALATVGRISIPGAAVDYCCRLHRVGPDPKVTSQAWLARLAGWRSFLE